jgi:hypothetical protein
MSDNAEAVVAPVAATPEAALEAAAIERGQAGFSDVTPETPSSPAVRPDHIPEQFWNNGNPDYEGLAKSYTALRAKMDSGEAAKAPETPAAPNATVGADGKIEKVEAPVPTEAEAAPLTTAMEAARTEWATSGEVSEEAIASLEAAGIPRDIFNLYIEGVKAQQSQILSSIHSFAGGEQTYTEMSRWAADNLSDAELDAYNGALDNPALRENAVRGLHARFSSVRPSEGRLLTPNSGSAGTGDTYSDRQELVKDTQDPRYSSDPAFRRSVQEKLQRSQAAGFQVVQRSMFEKQVYSNR